MRRVLAPALALCAAAAAPSCMQTPAQYFESRLWDLVDLAPVSLAAGYGVAAEIRITPYLGAGAGFANDWRVGTGEQRFGPVWYEKERGIPFWRYYRLETYEDFAARLPGGQPIWREENRRYRASSLVVFPGMSRDGEILWPVLPPYFIMAPWEWPGWSRWSLLNAEAGLFLGVVGARVGISPLQFVDFVFGLFALDPAEDDVSALPPLWPDPKARPSFPEEAETGS